MSATTVDLRPTIVPADYDEFFRNYYQYVRSLVLRSGINYQNSEDVTMTILTKFFEKSVLEDFNPDFTTTHGGVTRKAVFRTFLSGFVLSYVRHYVDRQRIEASRVGACMDEPVLQKDGSLTPWADASGHGVTETYETMFSADLIATVRRSLRQLPTPKSGLCPLPELFEAALEQVAMFGSTDLQKLQERFGTSKNTIRARLSIIRAEIRTAAEV